jgi:hypothetical protein
MVEREREALMYWLTLLGCIADIQHPFTSTGIPGDAQFNG